MLKPSPSRSRSPLLSLTLPDSIRRRKEIFPPAPPITMNDLPPLSRNPAPCGPVRSTPLLITPLIDSVAEDLGADPLIFKHSPVPDKRLAKFRQITEDDDPIEHLRRARLAVHPSNAPWDMEGSLASAVNKISNLREHTAEWRRRMLQEVDDLKCCLET